MTVIDREPVEHLVLLKEANHRFANQLMILAASVDRQISALGNDGPNLPRSVVRALWNDIAGRIISIAELHRLLAKNPSAEKIEVRPLLESMSRSLLLSLGLHDRAEMRLQLDNDCAVTTEQAQSIALIVSELILNAIKYAHPAGLNVKLEIACRRTAHGILIAVSDDGVGLPEGFDTARGGGTGFTVIRTLVKALDAKLDIQSTCLGATFELLLPA